MERLKVTLFVIAVLNSANLFAFKVSPNMTQDRTPIETLPIIGKSFQTEPEFAADSHDTDEAGVFYHNIPADLFMKIDYVFKVGTLKENLERAAKQYGWKLMWELRVDYDIPVDFTVKDQRLPEVFAEALEHLPIKTVFYARNKVIRVLPMYDKRESEHGSKFAISQSFD